MSIWFVRPTTERLAPYGGELNALLEIRVTEVGDDYLRGTMPVLPRVHQPMGILHGGASVVLAESLASMAANFCVDTSKRSCVGQEINANHLRPVSSGLITGTARPYHIGARSQVWGIEIRDDSGNLSCISRITLAVLSRPLLRRTE